MEKECECYEEEVQPYRKTDYTPIIYIYTGSIITDHKIIADEYNKYFVSIGGSAENNQLKYNQPCLPNCILKFN